MMPLHYMRHARISDLSVIRGRPMPFTGMHRIPNGMVKVLPLPWHLCKEGGPPASEMKPVAWEIRPLA